MTGGEAANDAMVADCSKTHGCDAATLRAIWLAAELTWRDDGLKIGGDGMRGPGKDAVCGGLRRCQEFSERRFVHVQDRVQRPEAKKLCNDCGTYRGGKNFRPDSALLGSEDAHPNLFGFGSFGPELEKLL